MSNTPAPGDRQVPSVWQIFLGYAKIGLTSFGGGMSAWMLRDFVQRRPWLTEGEFFNGVAVAQALPGINVVNMAIWFGHYWRGGLGAVAACMGIAVLPFFTALLILNIFDHLAQLHAVTLALAGVAAVAVGLSFNMGIRALRHGARKPLPAAFALVTFGALYFVKVPLYIVVLTLAPLSIAVQYHRMKKEEAASPDMENAA